MKKEIQKEIMINKKEFIFETGTEEIPARFMEALLNDLAAKAIELLNKARLSYSTVKTTGTYRRLTLIVSDLIEKQDNITKLIKGPPLKISIDEKGNYLPPAKGFAKKMNIKLADLKIIEEKGIKFIQAEKKEAGQNVQTLFQSLIPELISSLSLPIAMKWGTEKQSFIRPVHWILCMYDKEIIPFEIFGISSSNYSFGHRLLTKNTDDNFIASGAPVKIEKAKDYESRLMKSYVLVDQEKRKWLIKDYLEGKIDKNAIDSDLVTETTYLTEQPKPMHGQFDPEYLKIPKEVLIQCMKKNQKFFPVTRKGEFMPEFITIADNVTHKSSANIIAGNEEVLRARLEDVKFFWEADNKIKLESNLEKLKQVVFQKGLGTIYDKVLRLDKLSVYLTEKLMLNTYKDEIKRTVYLCKTDLVSNMVFELPGLQGTMGKLYALNQQEDSLVAAGIEEHYYPKYAGGQLPLSPTGIVTALADKFDTVVSCFQNGLIPTGSQDPWGVRRAVYGILQIVYNNKYTISLEKCIDKAYAVLNKDSSNKEELLRFFNQRLRSFYIDNGLSYDTVEATLANSLQNIIKSESISKALDIKRIEKPVEFKLLVDTAIRIKRLSPEISSCQVDQSLFEINEENTAWTAYNKTSRTIDGLYKNNEYDQLIDSLIDLSRAVTNYFDQVLVMSKNDKIKQNRLSFILSLNKLYQLCADFEKIVI
ncbi:MAG: glycine--tRNA ligase subunit beta [bacterium]|nr:glycine--tRNA ligase subunit beta [bacterium]